MLPRRDPYLVGAIHSEGLREAANLNPARSLAKGVLSKTYHTPALPYASRNGSIVWREDMAEAKKAIGKNAPTNPRGIPYAPFVDKVEEYVSTRADVEGCLNSFQEMISKYQFMQANTERRAVGLRDKAPDIQKTLDAVRFLAKRKGDAEPLESFFELNDTLYAKAQVLHTEEVYLWLGANVMLSYPIPEAEELLDQKLQAAKSSLANCEEDLDFLREQITTMEVATARVYNWDVNQRRKEKSEGKRDRDEDAKGRPNG